MRQSSRRRDAAEETDVIRAIPINVPSPGVTAEHVATNEYA
ncbi:MAG: hypothetical protein JWM83_1587 [Candidatus Angelobacter sp.]|nr:hypothetical protein [Candidatus Angelobacter sp.]